MLLLNKYTSNSKMFYKISKIYIIARLLYKSRKILGDKLNKLASKASYDCQNKRKKCLKCCNNLILILHHCWQNIGKGASLKKNVNFPNLLFEFVIMYSFALSIVKVRDLPTYDI